MAFLRQHFFPFLLLILLCITKLSGSAPVPADSTNLSALELRDEDLIAYFTERSYLADRAVDDADDLFVRSVAPQVEDNVLVRRKSIFTKIKEGFKKAGKAIKKGFQKAGKAIKKGFQKVGKGIKNVAKKVGNGIKTAAKKVGKFVKTTGAKIAKFGLQVVSTVGSVLGKVAKVVLPGIGKPISAALEGASKVTGLAANKIPAKLGGGLEKGFKIMDKIKNPVGGAAGAVLNILRRDIDEDEILFERYLDFEDIDAREIEEDILLEREAADFEQVDARDVGKR